MIINPIYNEIKPRTEYKKQYTINDLKSLSDTHPHKIEFFKQLRLEMIKPENLKILNSVEKKLDSIIKRYRLSSSEKNYLEKYRRTLNSLTNDEKEKIIKINSFVSDSFFETYEAKFDWFIENVYSYREAVSSIATPVHNFLENKIVKTVLEIVYTAADTVATVTEGVQDAQGIAPSINAGAKITQSLVVIVPEVIKNAFHAFETSFEEAEEILYLGYSLRLSQDIIEVKKYAEWVEKRWRNKPWYKLLISGKILLDSVSSINASATYELTNALNKYKEWKAEQELAKKQAIYESMIGGY